MGPLRRHRLAYLTDSAWRDLLARRSDGQARQCLQHWADHRLPLVVTRQPPSQPGTDNPTISLGLAAPNRWGRIRLNLRIAFQDILFFDEFPQLADLDPILPSVARRPARQLALALADSGCRPRVYGSYGWQLLTGLDHVRPGSDLDLLVCVDSAGQADAAIQCLRGFEASCRLDGELMFLDGSAVAWREWALWRSRQTRKVLVKDLNGAFIRDARELEQRLFMAPA